MIGCGQRAGNGVARAVLFLTVKKNLDGVLKAAMQQMRVALEGDEAAHFDARLQRQMKAVNGIEEEQRAHALIQIFTAITERFQVLAFRKQLLQRSFTTEGIERLIAHGGVRRGDDLAEVLGHTGCYCWASISTRLERTSSRSLPSKAKASCAVNKPYLRPMS